MIYNISPMVATMPPMPDPHLISSEQHFDSTRRQIATKAAYFRIDSLVLSGIKYAGMKTEKTSVLTNVKCYPIDLVTQVDKGGNIFIDNNTNKPIDIATVQGAGAAAAEGNTDQNTILNQQAQQANTNSWIRFVIAFAIILLIVVAVIVVLVVFVFRGKTYNNTPYVPAAAAASAVPVAIAPVTAAATATATAAAAATAATATAVPAATGAMVYNISRRAANNTLPGQTSTSGI